MFKPKYIHEISAWIDRPDAVRAYSLHRDGDRVLLHTVDLSGPPVDLGTAEIPLKTAKHYAVAWDAFARTNSEWLAQIDAAEFAARGTSCAALPGVKIKFYRHQSAILVRFWPDHRDRSGGSETPIHNLSEMARKYPEAWAEFVRANGGIDPAAPPAPRVPQPLPGEYLPGPAVPAQKPVPMPGERVEDLQALTARRLREQWDAQARKSSHAAAVVNRQRQSEENNRRMDEIAARNRALGL
jgi:hypothetical protein